MLSLIFRIVLLIWTLNTLDNYNVLVLNFTSPSVEFHFENIQPMLLDIWNKIVKIVSDIGSQLGSGETKEPS